MIPLDQSWQRAWQSLGAVSYGPTQAEQKSLAYRRSVYIAEDMKAGDVFTAALELWVAARTDPELLGPVADLEAQIGRGAHRIAIKALDIEATAGGSRELVQATLDLIRGLGLANQLTDDSARRKRVLDAWAITLDDQLSRVKEKR